MAIQELRRTPVLWLVYPVAINITDITVLINQLCGSDICIDSGIEEISCK